MNITYIENKMNKSIKVNSEMKNGIANAINLAVAKVGSDFFVRAICDRNIDIYKKAA